MKKYLILKNVCTETKRVLSSYLGRNGHSHVGDLLRGRRKTIFLNPMYTQFLTSVGCAYVTR